MLGSGVDAQNPWPGLVAFAEELQQFFHGRAEEADELLRRVERKDLTVLFGQSGLGKSSLLQAGLFPRLRAEGYMPVPIRLDHAAVALPLSEQVKAAVIRTILGAGGRAENAASEAGDTLWEHFHRRGLCQQMGDGQTVRLVLVFDQFEELFAIGHASEETRARAAHFLTELADLVENRAPEALERRLEESPELVKQFALDDRGYRAIICLREDYLPHLESLRPSMPSIAENRMRLTRMTGLRALEAVVNPGGDLITPEVGRQVVRFVAGGRLREPGIANGEHEDDGLALLEVEPSLLSLVCRELNNRRLTLGLPHITADLLAGSRELILQDFYERCVADQPPAVRAFVEDELVTDSGLRENIALERARKALTQHGATPAAIDELVKRRLLHLEERLDIQRVELTHDVLTAVVKKSRDQREQKEATLKAELHSQVIREKARRQRRRLRLIVGAMGAALIVVTGFGAWSYNLYLDAERQKEQAKQARLEAVTEKDRAEREKDRAEENQKLALETTAEQRELLDRIGDDRLKTVPGEQKNRLFLLEIVLEHHEKRLRKRPNDVGKKATVADLCQEIGVLLSEIGVVANAVTTLNKVVEYRRQLAADDPESAANTAHLGNALFQLGECFWQHKRSREAVAPLRESLAIFGELSKRFPADARYKAAEGKALYCLTAVNPGKDDLTAYQKVYDLLAEAVKAFPDDMDVLVHFARVSLGLGVEFANGNQEDKATKCYEEAERLAEIVIKKNPASVLANRTRTMAKNDRGIGLRDAGRLEDAVRVIQQAVMDAKAFAGQNPAVLLAHTPQIFVQKNLAETNQRLRPKDEQAILAWEDVVRTCEELAQRFPQGAQFSQERIRSLISISDIQKNGNRKPDAAATLGRALAAASQTMDRHPHSSAVMNQLLIAFLNRGLLEADFERPDEALRFFLEGIAIFEGYSDLQGEDREGAIGIFLDCVCQATDRYKQLKDNPAAIQMAIQLAERSIPAGESLKDADSRQRWLNQIASYAQCCDDAGQTDKAIAAWVLIRDRATPRVQAATWDFWSCPITFAGLTRDICYPLIA